MSVRQPVGPRGVALETGGTWQHGTSYGYDKRGCRCEPCVLANREAKQRRREALRGLTPPKHGLSGYTDYICRCEECRAAWSAYTVRHKARANASSRDAAHRHGDLWLEREEQAAMEATSVREAARLLRRTLRAIETRRSIVTARGCVDA